MLQIHTELLNTKQAAEYLGVTVSTLEVWRCTQRYAIPYVKIGGLVKYKKAALDDFIESRTVGVESAGR